MASAVMHMRSEKMQECALFNVPYLVRTYLGIYRCYSRFRQMGLLSLTHFYNPFTPVLVTCTIEFMIYICGDIKLILLFLVGILSLSISWRSSLLQICTANHENKLRVS